jgi:hypothetical protein
MKKRIRPEFQFEGAPAAHVANLQAHGIDVETHDDEVIHVVSPPVEEPATVPTMRLQNTQVRLETAVRGSFQIGDSLRQMFARIAAEWRQAKLAITLALAAGVVIGLPILGWWLWPVEWTDSTYKELAPPHQQAVVDMAADLLAVDPLNPNAIRFIHLYPGLHLDTCELAEQTVDVNIQARRRALAYKVTGQDCR